MIPDGHRLVFPLGAGGPFHRLQVALRLADEDRPNVGRRALIVLTVSWLPLGLLWWWQGLGSNDTEPAESLFTQLATYARFFVTLPLLIVAVMVPFLPVLATAFPMQELASGVIHVFLGRAE